MNHSGSTWNEKHQSEDAAIALLVHTGYVEAPPYEVALVCSGLVAVP
jgi:hypothetical protein